MLNENVGLVQGGTHPGGLTGDTLYSRDWLLSRPPEELVEIILRLKNAVDKSTDHLLPDLARTTFDTSAQPHEYVRFPVIPRMKSANGSTATWRIALYTSLPGYEPFGMEIYDEVIMGRTEINSQPDVDLTGYDAALLGVSRQHALFRPTPTGLLMVDMFSTNGTYCNAFKLAPGVMARLKDSDTISFGRLHFMLKIVQRP